MIKLVKNMKKNHKNLKKKKEHRNINISNSRTEKILRVYFIAQYTEDLLKPPRGYNF